MKKIKLFKIQINKLKIYQIKLMYKILYIDI